ncbi:MAG: glycosyl hydrolase family 17 protein [Roseibacillus sp.]
MKALFTFLLSLAIIFPAFSQEKKELRQKSDALLTGQHWAICYSGFRDGQHPDRGQGAINPSDEEILEDLKILAEQCGFKLIRLYDSQTNSEAVLRLIREHKLGLTVLLGAWLDAEVNNPNCPWQKEPYPETKLAENKVKNQQEIERAISLAKRYPNQVVAVAVGNEALVDWNDHMVPVEQIITYVKEVKAAIKQPVTVADNYEWWAQHGQALAKELDFVSVHIYPVWEGKDIHQAMDYSIANMEKVRAALPDSELVITEAGWATIATEFGERASEKKQTLYYGNLERWAKEMNITTFFFEAFDESWKGDPGSPWGAEKHWGIFFADRTPKEVMKKHLKK